MANNSKKCEICNTSYKYCNNCGEYKDYPRWMFLFHDENCKNIWSAINAYRAKEKTAYEAKKELEKLDLSNKENFKEVYKKYIDEIFDTAVEPEPVKEKKVYNNSESKYNGSKKSYKK